MFVRGGSGNPGYYLDFAGSYGYYWSSVGRNSSYAYYLYFSPGRVYPSNYYARYFGFSVRCVALGDYILYCMKNSKNGKQNTIFISQNV